MSVAAAERNPGNPEHQLQVFDLEEVLRLHQEGYTDVPLIEKIQQTCKPGEMYRHLRTGDSPSFLLESSELGEPDSRFSFIGLDPEMTIRLEKGPIAARYQMRVTNEAGSSLQDFGNDPYGFVHNLVSKDRKVAEAEGMPPFFGGAAGYFGYDLARYIEPTIGEPGADTQGLPELALIVPQTTLSFDQESKEASIIANLQMDKNMSRTEVRAAYHEVTKKIRDTKARIEEFDGLSEKSKAYAEPTFVANINEQEFKTLVETAKKHVYAGDTFQSVPSRCLSSLESYDKEFALEVYDELKQLNPSRYGFHIDFGDFAVAGCSPETLVKVTGTHVEHHAIAGTVRRGKTPGEDAANVRWLADNQKEIAEHHMLVDLGRNDLAKVCEEGTVDVPILRAIEAYSHVHHGVSTISGRLKDALHALDVLKSILPSGTLSGAPKIRAMQIVNELEPTKRGPYGGAVGYITPKGDLDTCIYIRSFAVDPKGKVHVQSGAGIVADSDPQSEYDETVVKSGAVMAAIKAVCGRSKESIPTQYIPKSRGEFTKQRLAAAEKPRPFRKKQFAHTLGKLVMIDNYDSYVYLLADLLATQGASVEVVRNDVVNARDLIGMKPDYLVVSPGPGNPEHDAGISAEAMEHFAKDKIPVLGVCLGHQVLAHMYGAAVEPITPMHGKSSVITHDGQGIFSELPGNKITVQRYHSLAALPPIPQELEATAWTEDDIVMGLRHKEMPWLEGVQFHPESLFTQYGSNMARRFLRLPQDETNYAA